MIIDPSRVQDPGSRAGPAADSAVGRTAGASGTATGSAPGSTGHAVHWRGRLMHHHAITPSSVPHVHAGWLGRLRHVLQGRAQRVVHSGEQRQADLALAPVRTGHGFSWLRAISGLSQRLHGTLARLQAQHRADVAALAATPGQIATTTSAATVALATPAAAAVRPAAPELDRDSTALAQVTAAVHQRLAAQAADKDAFNTVLHQAFGDRFDATKAEALRQQTLAGDFSWVPRIELKSSAELADLSGTQAAGQAQGAYAAATDTIYLSRELLHSDPAQAQRILMEEIGHGIDARINTSDAVGDEGEIFAKLMHGDKISATEMAALKADNDSGTVMINGRSVAVEYGWLKKLVKAVTGGIKKVVSAVVHGAVNLVKSSFKVTTGLLTLNFNRVREGLQEGVQAVVTTVKTVAKAVRDTTKAVLKIAKDAFVKLMQSKLFAAVLMVCRFIPIPVVQLVVRVVDLVRAAYMVYQGVKNRSLGAVLGGVASLAGGAGNLAGSLGASASTVAAIRDVADAASKLSMAYNAVANKDLGSALGLLGAATGAPTPGSTLATLSTAAGYAQQALAVRDAVRRGDALGALGGTLAFAGSAAGADSATGRQLAQANEVVTGLRAVQALSRGQLDAAQGLASGMQAAQAASQRADEILAQRRADAAAAEAEAAAAAAAAAAKASAPADVKDSNAEAAPSAANSDAPSAATADTSNTQPEPAATPARTTPATLTVRSGQTLEAIARANYGDNWRAGLAQLALDNGLKLNQWGSPILRTGQELQISDLSTKSDTELASLSRLGGKLIANNSSGLKVKAELEERARQEAAQKIAEASQAAAQAASAALPQPTASSGANAPAGTLAEGRAGMNAYWSSVADDGVNQGSFVKYLAGQTMQKLGNVGYNLAEMAVAVNQRPDQALAGGVKSIVNFGPDAFNAATSLVKTSADGYTLLAEKLGAGDGSLAWFRDSKPLQITPLASYDNPAQAGGALLTQAALGVGLAKYGNYRLEPNLGTPGTLYANPIPVKLVAPEAVADTAVMSGPVTFRAPAGATAEEIAQMQRYVDGSNEALKAGQLSETGRVSTAGQLRTDASLAAARERARAAAAGTEYQGHAGHVPDTTWTGNPKPYQWQDLTPKVNSSLGAQAKNYPIGYKPTSFSLEKP